MSGSTQGARHTGASPPLPEGVAAATQAAWGEDAPPFHSQPPPPPPAPLTLVQFMRRVPNPDTCSDCEMAQNAISAKPWAWKGR